MKNRLIKITPIFLILAFVICEPKNQCSASSDIIVTSKQDSGSGSLREAIQTAQPGDRILFDPTGFPPDDSMAIYLENPLPLLHAGGVTINGAGAGVILDGSLLEGNETPAYLDDINLVFDEGENVIENGDFSSNLRNWHVHQLGGDDNFSWNASVGAREVGAFEITPDPRQGESILFYYPGELGGAVSYDSVSIPLPDTLNEESRVSLSFWHQNVEIGIGLFFHMEDGSILEFGDSVRKSGEWTQKSIQFDVPTGATGYLFWFVIYPNFLHGFWINSDGNNLQGLQIRNFPGAGIFLDGASRNQIGGKRGGADSPCLPPCNLISGNYLDGIFIEGGESNIVQGNFIGTNLDGDNDFGNERQGIRIFNSSDNVIGGEGGEANLISGNSIGVEINLPDSYGNQVIGNNIGMDVTGSKIIGNSRAGIALALNAHNNLIRQNILTGNDTGIVLDSNCYQNIIQNNWIGTGWDGKEAFGNRSDGIRLTNGAHDNQIGPGNWITGNLGSGVVLLGQDTVLNRITQNSITENIGPGIEINNQVGIWVSPPTLVGVTSQRVYGESEPGMTIELYVDPKDEGEIYLGQVTVREDGTFNWLMPIESEVDNNITGLAISPEGSTSTFSAPLPPPELVLQELPGIITPEQISKEPEVIGLNLVFSLGSLVYIGLLCTYFNETMESYSQELSHLVSSPWQRIKKTIRLPQLSSLFMNRFRVGYVLIKWLLMFTLISAVQAFLNPVPLFSSEYFSTVLTLALAGLMVSGLEAICEWLVRWRIGKGAEIHETEVSWIGLFLAIISAALSRLMRFVPGFVLGAVDTFYFLPVLQGVRQEGIRALVTKLTVLFFTSLGWMLSPWAAKVSAGLEVLLLTTFLVGLEYVFFVLIPFDVLDGASLFKWNRSAWGILLSLSLFGTFHFVLNPSSSGVQAFRQNGIQTVILVMVLILILVVGLRIIVVVSSRKRGQGSQNP